MSTDRSREEIEQIRELLRSADLPADVFPADVTVQDDQLLERVRSGAVPARLVRVASRAASRPAWRRSVTRVAVAAVAVVAVVVGGIVYQGVRAPASAGTPPLLHFSDADIASVLAGQGQPADDALTALAATAASRTEVRGGDYQETTSYSWYEKISDVATVLVPSYESFLLGPDGSVVHSQIETDPLDGHGRVVHGDTPPGGTGGGTDEFPAGSLDPQQAANLPRDPQALRAALIATEQGAGCDASERATAECLVRAVKDLAAFYVLPPDLDAALWTVLADDPHIVRLGTTTDRLGRAGVAVAVQTGEDAPHGALVLVVSADDGRLLEWDDIAASAPDLGVDSPVVTSFQVYLSAAWVAKPQ